MRLALSSWLMVLNLSSGLSTGRMLVTPMELDLLMVELGLESTKLTTLSVELGLESTTLIVESGLESTKLTTLIVELGLESVPTTFTEELYNC